MPCYLIFHSTPLFPGAFLCCYTLYYPSNTVALPRQYVLFSHPCKVGSLATPYPTDYPPPTVSLGFRAAIWTQPFSHALPIFLGTRSCCKGTCMCSQALLLSTAAQGWPQAVSFSSFISIELFSLFSSPFCPFRGAQLCFVLAMVPPCRLYRSLLSQELPHFPKCFNTTPVPAHWGTGSLPASHALAVFQAALPQRSGMPFSCLPTWRQAPEHPFIGSDGDHSHQLPLAPR